MPWGPRHAGVREREGLTTTFPRPPTRCLFLRDSGSYLSGDRGFCKLVNGRCSDWQKATNPNYLFGDSAVPVLPSPGAPQKDIFMNREQGIVYQFPLSDSKTKN